MGATGGAVKPLPWKGRRGLGIRVEALSYGKRGLGKLRYTQSKTAKTLHSQGGLGLGLKNSQALRLGHFPEFISVGDQNTPLSH